MIDYLWVALGSALGGMTRHWLSGYTDSQMGGTFPYGTLLVNVTGSLAIGAFMSLAGQDGRWAASNNLRAFFAIGICGGYTTFSSFSLQTLNLIRNEEWLKAGINMLASVIFCLLAVWLGHFLSQKLFAK